MLRVCDQLGFVSMINNQRTIQFSQQILLLVKTLQIFQQLVIPDASDVKCQTFMQSIIKQTKSAMNKQSEAQTEALKQMEEYRAKIAAVKLLMN
jgi:regulator of PEP synthase PpsR (kinase-PPPase family)